MHTLIVGLRLVHKPLLWVLCLLFSIIAFPACAEPRPVDSMLNIVYGDNASALDLFIPKTDRKKTALLFIHGGGFTQGDKKAMNGYAKLLAQGGFTSVSVNYRLAPKHPYPAALEDVTAALAWLRDHAVEFGFDRNKIVPIGYSAGGTLALNLALNNKLQLPAGVSVAGVTDIGKLISSTPHKRLRRDLKSYTGAAVTMLPSPIFQVNKLSSPVFLFHGDTDRLVPVSQSVLLAQKLKSLEVPVLLRVFPKAGHEIMLPNKHLKQLLEELTRFLLAVDSQ